MFDLNRGQKDKYIAAKGKRSLKYPHNHITPYFNKKRAKYWIISNLIFQIDNILLLKSLKVVPKSSVLFAIITYTIIKLNILTVYFNKMIVDKFSL